MTYFAAVLTGLLLTAPAWAKLEISQIEAARGPLGPLRPSLDIYPLDEVMFRYQVSGAHVSAEGVTDCESTIKLTNADGKIVFEQKIPLRRHLTLGANTMPGYALVAAPEKAPPGVYSLAVRLRDNLSKEEAGFERKLTCKPITFQIVAPSFWRDAEAKLPSAAAGVVGETIHFKLRVIGFDKSAKKVRTTLTIAILDDAGKPATENPQVIKAELTSAEEAAKSTQVNFNGQIYLNRPGNFTLRLTANDLEGKQQTVFETPLKAAAP